jgi:hypothetical protein
MKNQVDFGDWWNAKDMGNALVLHREGERGIYCSEWINPTPKVPIATVTVRSHGNAIPIILSITGKKVFAQKVDRTE